MRAPDLRLTILKAVKVKEFYGYEIQRKLAADGINVEVGRLYKVLGQMLQDGWLESRWEKSAIGPKKKLYKLGKEGKLELDKILLNAIQTIHKAYGEYLLSLPPEKSVFQAISKSIAGEKNGKCIIALVAESPSPMYQRLLSDIQKKLAGSRIFVVKPKATSLRIELEDTAYVEGSLENVPLKDSYLDLLIATSLPLLERMETVAGEWHRVINNNGRIAILSPRVLFDRYEDPLAIGDFMEKWEHQIYEDRKPGEGEILLNCLKRHFQRVEERNIVHMKLILADYSNQEAI